MQKVNYMISLAQTFEEHGEYERAAQVLQGAVRIKEQHLGVEHLDLAEDLYNLGLLYFALDKHYEAERLLRRSLDISSRHLGPDHPETVEVQQMLHELCKEIDAYALVVAPFFEDAPPESCRQAS